jgi:hypothetical protein
VRDLNEVLKDRRNDNVACGAPVLLSDDCYVEDESRQGWERSWDILNWDDCELCFWICWSRCRGSRALDVYLTLGEQMLSIYH